jgi:hypothetical protein
MRVDRTENTVEWERKTPDGQFWELAVWTNIPKNLSNEEVLYPAISLGSKADVIRIVK